VALCDRSIIWRGRRAWGRRFDDDYKKETCRAMRCLVHVLARKVTDKPASAPLMPAFDPAPSFDWWSTGSSLWVSWRCSEQMERTYVIVDREAFLPHLPACGVTVREPLFLSRADLHGRHWPGLTRHCRQHHHTISPRVIANIRHNIC
jgi:hypothetical protein